MKDREILEMIKDKDILFLTLDRDFIFLYPKYKGRVSIVIFTVHPPLPKILVEILEYQIDKIEKLEKCLILIDKNFIRVIR